MDIADAVAFITENDRAVLATRKRDDRLQMSPVSAGVIDGKIVISSRSHLAKVANLRRNAAVSVLVFTTGFFGPWVQVDGTAEIVEQPEALDLLDEVYRAIVGEHPDWADYRRAMIADRRVVIRITPQSASGQL
ncbi:PPOX class F420-dependent oxidoreductase [Nakamurella panacisegetis]|nr:PPOX class F420-dependent oxidoreductase [Nakamurella panacisegetis]